MIYRACVLKRDDIAMCNCTDAEMQPCFSVVINRYLEDLAEFGPDNPWFRECAQNDLILMSIACGSESELLFEITGDGSYLD